MPLIPFDEPKVGDTHGACNREIASLRARLAKAEDRVRELEAGLGQIESAADAKIESGHVAPDGYSFIRRRARALRPAPGGEPR